MPRERKRIAILTPGESLARVWRDDLASDYELVFAVNRAGLFFRCDYLAYVDAIVHRSLDRYHEPRRAYLSACSRSGGIGSPPTYPLRMWGSRLYGIHIRKTFPCVLYEARDLAKSWGVGIDIYGLDMSSGVGLGGDCAYPSDRWEQELCIMAIFWPTDCRVFGDISPDRLAWIHEQADLIRRGKPPIWRQS